MKFINSAMTAYLFGKENFALPRLFKITPVVSNMRTSYIFIVKDYWKRFFFPTKAHDGICFCFDLKCKTVLFTKSTDFVHGNLCFCLPALRPALFVSSGFQWSLAGNGNVELQQEDIFWMWHIGIKMNHFCLFRGGERTFNSTPPLPRLSWPL